MKKSIKKITLPSGGTCTVRRMSQSDYIESGHAPVFLRLAAESKRKAPRAESVENDVEIVRAGIDLIKAKLLRCCGAITDGGGHKFKIVDKPNVDDVADDEISIEMLEQADAEAICDAIDELSGLTKEAAEAAAKFPEKEGPGSSGASAGADVSPEPGGLPETQSV